MRVCLRPGHPITNQIRIYNFSDEMIKAVVNKES